MKSNQVKNVISYVGIVLSFFVISYIFLYPMLEGKWLKTNDLMQYRGMSKELHDFRQETGEEGLWTNSMFGGMPGYLIDVKYPGNLFTGPFESFVGRTYPAGMIILYFVGFFILLSALRINKWLSLVGAFAFAFSSYFIIIIGAGHTSKGYAIAFLPVVVAGVLLIYRGKYVSGALLYTIGLTFEILATHYQITYYGIILLSLYVIVEFIYTLKEKQIHRFLKASALLITGSIVAVGINSAKLYSTWEYSKQTIRGPSELTGKEENQTSGLDRDYILRWSQGIDETLTLLIPNFKGGSSDTRPGIDSKSYQLMQRRRVPQMNEALNQIYHYHGGKPGTAGPVYVGAIIFFLFVLGLFLVKGRLKWWLFTAAIIAVVLSWGKNFMFLSNFLIEYLPLYNKFRAPDMILVIAELSIALLAVLTLNKIYKGELQKNDFYFGLKWSFIIVGGITLLFSVFPGLFDDFSAHTDFSRSSGKPIYPDWLQDGIARDRSSLKRADAFRSFIFVSLGALVLLGFVKNKLKQNSYILLIGALIVADLWLVDRRYLNSDSFVSAKQEDAYYQPNVADLEILKDTSIGYKVLPLNNPFNNTHYSYYHNNLMGYHAAKLRRPHELMNFYLVSEMEALGKYFNHQDEPFRMPRGFNMMNMLNARYIITHENRPPVRNPFSLGYAWFVEDIKIVENADEEFQELKTLSPETAALVDKRFEYLIPNRKFVKSGGEITLNEYQPNYLNYSFTADEDKFTVFSEIYYDKGWNAYIDGEKVPHFRVNYVLRAMILPAGAHTIEFKFEPKSYYLGNKISLASSVLLILAVLSYAAVNIRRQWLTKKNSQNITE